MRCKLKKLLITLIITLISFIGLSFLSNDVKAFEVFNEDYRTYGNYFGIPMYILGDDTSLWCSAHHAAYQKYITAPKAISNASGANDDFPGLVLGDDGYGVGRTVVTGVKNNGVFYKNYYRLNSSGGKLGGFTKKDNLDVLNRIQSQESGLPLNNSSKGLAFKNKIGASISTDNVLYSINYVLDQEVTDENIRQSALYVLSAGHFGKLARTDTDTITVDQRKQGYFKATEKQYALWELAINTGDPGNSDDDRGLGNIANAYQNFYNQIRINGYSGIVNVKT